MVVRTGFESHEVMVTVVINGKKLPKPELLADLMFYAIDSLNDGVAQRIQDAAEREGKGSVFVLDETGEPAVDEEGELIFDYDVVDSLEYQENWYELEEPCRKLQQQQDACRGQHKARCNIRPAGHP